jgi:aspartate/methionine/tyrosine aminotransferase
MRGLCPRRRVAVAPAERFGRRGAGYARLSLVTDEALDAVLERLREGLA